MLAELPAAASTNSTIVIVVLLDMQNKQEEYGAVSLVHHRKWSSQENGLCALVKTLL